MKKTSTYSMKLYTYFLQKTFIKNLAIIFPKLICRFKIIKAYEIELLINCTNIYSLLYFLKNNTVTQCKFLTDLIIADTPGKNKRFFITYLIQSIYNYRLKITSKISDLTFLMSIGSLYSTSIWLEREAFDFFGILFVYNKDLRRILTDYGFQGYPLRKDFPISGFIDLFYDDNEKRIIYKTLEFSQELKQFSFKKL